MKKILLLFLYWDVEVELFSLWLMSLAWISFQNKFRSLEKD